MKYSLFTVGHSNLTLESFIALLTKHNITALADVRSSPYSRYLPHFNKNNVQKTLSSVGIKYVFLGQELGARPSDKSCYIEGKAVYEKIAETSLFAQGIERIIKGSQSYNIALMCAEKDPITCHRAILVCQHLKSFPLEINHILSDSTIESHQQLESRLLKIHDLTQVENNNVIQLDLFNSFPSQTACQNLSLDDILREAYRRQGDKIAYVEKKHD